jgi:hypothetical protein
VNLTDDLHDLVAHEPPYRLDPEAAIAGGRRRRRTRGTALALATGTTAVGVVAAVLVAQAHEPAKQQTLFGATPPVATVPQGPVESVVRAHTPAGWSFERIRESTADSFQADVDDGAGPSRLSVGLSPSPGTLQQHPCSDPEFSLGATCREQDLDADTRLVVRSPVQNGPVRSQYVVIVHRDGSGVDVGNDNATWPWVEEIRGPVTPEQKRLMSTPDVQRADPVYSLAQLVEIAKAVDAAT